MGRENVRLPVETKPRAVNVRLLRKNADVVRQIPRRKIVRAIDDYVVTGNDFERVLAREPALICFDFDVRIHVAQTITRGIQFSSSDVFRPVQNLSLQIAKIDIIEIDQTELPNAGGRQINRRRRAESTRTDA